MKTITFRLPLACLLALALGASLPVSPTQAHHSFVAHYIPDQEVMVKGVVEEFWFENPHARIVINTEPQSGDTQRWILETGSKNNLIRSGWEGDEIQPGQLVEATGHPSRDGSNTMELRVLTLPDGTIYRSAAGSLRAAGAD